MNFERLRQLLLEQAIRGKLVPQLESEPIVTQIGEKLHDVPFIIPDKWKWVQLRAVGKIIGGGTPKTNIPEYWENGDIPWFTPADLGKVTDIYVETSARKITTKGLAYSSATLMPKNSILFSSRAPIGYIALAKEDCCTNQGCKSFVANESVILPMWAYWVLKARTADIVSRASGTTFKEISGRGMGDTWIPLPPIEEQNRIVEQLNKLFDLIDCAEKAYNELSGPLFERFRQLCLEKAIQGKLVPQLESEPDSCQIGKPPSKVPFSIPKKWKWVALGSAFHLKAGKFISAHEIKNYGMYPCYGGNGKRGYVDKFNREGKFPLIGRQGALCGNINLVEGKFYATEHAVVADGGELVDPDCAAFFLEFLNLNQYATKTAQPGLSVKRISETPYPLPPLAEQKRIAHKVQKLFKMFEKIDC